MLRIIKNICALTTIMTIGCTIISCNSGAKQDNAQENKSIQLSNCENSTLYKYNLESAITIIKEQNAIPNRSYNFLKISAALQGIINRNVDNGMSNCSSAIYYKYFPNDEVAQKYNFKPDDFWFESVSSLISFKKIKNIEINKSDPTLGLLNEPDITRHVKGIVLWSDRYPATANLASTIAGLLDYLPVNINDKDMASIISKKFTGLPKFNIIESLNITDMSYSKQSVYEYGIKFYIDHIGNTIPSIAYTVDSFSRPELNGLTKYNDQDWKLFNRMLVNSDFFIQKRSFFVDLNPSTDGKTEDHKFYENAELNKNEKSTLNNIFYQLRKIVNRNTIISMYGFSPWHIKYSDKAENIDKSIIDMYKLSDPYYQERDLVNLASTYYIQVDADAPSLMGLANASLFSHIPLNIKAQQKPQLSSEIGIETDPNVSHYIMLYMGDYDSSAWMAGSLPALWNNRDGKIPLAWSVVPSLSSRVPQIFNYIFNTKQKNDYFVFGDSGGGYINPSNLPDDQLVPWSTYNDMFSKKFGIDIAGFVITGDGNFSRKSQYTYANFAKGIGYNNTSEVMFYKKNNQNTILSYKTLDASKGHAPHSGELFAEGLKKDLETTSPNQKFLSLRTILADPSILSKGVEIYNKQHPTKKIKVLDPYNWLNMQSNDRNIILAANRNNNLLFNNRLVAADSPNYYLILQSDGNLVLYDSNVNKVNWSSLSNGGKLTTGYDKSFSLELQNDGNLVEYGYSNNNASGNDRVVIWSSNTKFATGDDIINFIFNKNGISLTSSNSYGNNYHNLWNIKLK